MENLNPVFLTVQYLSVREQIFVAVTCQQSHSTTFGFENRDETEIEADPWLDIPAVIYTHLLIPLDEFLQEHFQENVRVLSEYSTNMTEYEEGSMCIGYVPVHHIAKC